MVLDTSALVAILNDEPERAAMVVAIERDPIRLVSSVSVVEASLVLATRWGADAVDDLDLLLSRIGAEIVPFRLEDVSAARTAHAQFGKGRHRAGLNFGDCFAYALAVSRGEPLLYKGKDFAFTGIVSALSDTT